MAGKAGGRDGLPWRLGRLFMGPNKLRRRTDRAESVIVFVLSVVFLAAMAAAPYLGVRIYQVQETHAPHLHPSVAVLSQRGPTGDYIVGYGQAAARWRMPDGQWRSGTLTTDTAPGISGAPAGARIQVWLNGSGQPAAPPGTQAGRVFTAALLTMDAIGVAAIVLFIFYLLCRRALDRRRLAEWESDWALTGPRWTTRR
jgi:hypothetical protein